MTIIFNAITFIGGWVAVGILALSVSAGLYLACELAEEYSFIVKRYLKISTITLAVTFLFLTIDGLPITNCFFGTFCYVCYLPLLSTFPFVQPLGLQTIGAAVLSIAHHVLWFNYFTSEMFRLYLTHHGTSGIFGMSPAMRVMGFLFVFVWLVPLGFFISLTSVEESLPFASGGQQQRKKKGLFKGFVDSLLERKDEMFPARVKRYQ
eukprot:CAMPEP_0197260452 /NCGR_PEP_ID=MMETSP1429-20130617/84041_1 /TAXON_ID=49237 /ORGANISM="Chaetoceros  sp., Strain UNC1202" /LENGTH=206 /DNA_ID=CAMNT_0042724693 /DNA_START=52 /DNA_END=672 /DNA_ORIENTATION=+